MASKENVLPYFSPCEDRNRVSFSENGNEANISEDSNGSSFTEDVEFRDMVDNLDVKTLFTELEMLTNSIITVMPKFFASFCHTFLKEKFQGIEGEFQSKLNKFYLTGSLTEGSAFARLLNPKLPVSNMEMECDFLILFGEVSMDKARSLIESLPYAKGFVWLKYGDDIDMDEFPDKSQARIDVNGEQYFKASAFRKSIADTTFSMSSNFKNNLVGFEQQEAGPSAALESFFKPKELVKQIPRRDQMKEGLEVLHEIVDVLAKEFPTFTTLYQEFKRSEGELKAFLLDKVSQGYTLTQIDIESLFDEYKVVLSNCVRREQNLPSTTCSGHDDYDDHKDNAHAKAQPSPTNDVTANERVVTAETQVDRISPDFTRNEKNERTVDTQVHQKCPDDANNSQGDSLPKVQMANEGHERKVDTQAELRCQDHTNNSKGDALQRDESTNEGHEKVNIQGEQRCPDHPGTAWYKSLNALASAMHEVLSVLSDRLQKFDFSKHLGYHRHHILPLLSKLLQLRHDFIQIHLTLGALKKKLLIVHQKNPSVIIPLILNDLLAQEENNVSLYLVVLEYARHSLRILRPRLSVLDAVCHDYERLYGRFVKEGAPIAMSDEEYGLIECFSGSMDRVPALTVQGWPDIAEEWKTRMRKWPQQHIVDQIIVEGCHLVPKPYKGAGGNADLDWRWSFSRPEITLAHARTERMALCYLIFKGIFYKYFKVLEVEDSTLSSYFAKTTMLYVCEAHDESWWQCNSIVLCVSILLGRFKTAVMEGWLPHYFIPEINLFDGLPEELLMQAHAVVESLLIDISVPIIETLTGLHKAQDMFKKRKGQDDQQNSRDPHLVTNASGKLSQIDGSGDNPSAKETNLAETNVQTENHTGDKDKDKDVPSIDLDEFEALPLTFAKMRACVMKKKANFAGIREKQGVISIFENVLEHVKHLYPEAWAISDDITLEGSDNYGDISITLPLTWDDRPLHRIPTVSIDFRCGRNLRISFDLFN